MVVRPNISNVCSVDGVRMYVRDLGLNYIIGSNHGRHEHAVVICKPSLRLFQLSG